MFSGERGIRTPGTSQYNGFQDRRNRPLCHLSCAVAKIRENFERQNKILLFYGSTLKWSVKETNFYFVRYRKLNSKLN